ncbi:hypothetical protein RND81_14G038000 [Saponaria officinalis]|uniref:EF-hand domain-containing protein n=1 Tax=Saponaria officinalis TaxID=3572 RepID=A0AAW1GKR7_SAPOF
MRSHFPPGTEPKIIDCFNRIDKDGDGVIDDMELQSVLSSNNNNFSMSTVHLLMFKFNHSNIRVLSPKEFVALVESLRRWRAMFKRFDRDRNGSIDSSELGKALMSLGFGVSPLIVNTLISKFSKSGATSLPYDCFIEFCLLATELFEICNEKADNGTASSGSMDLGTGVLRKYGIICNFFLG